MNAPSPDQPIDDIVVRRQKRRRRHLAEIVATVLLSLGSVAISWSTYQAVNWSGVQATSYARANALRVDSSREFTLAGLLQTVDIALFANWANAYAAGNDRLQSFYRARFRPEFQPAFAAWLASKPLLNPRAPPTPFTLPEYRIGRHDRATELAEAAQQEFVKGQQANDHATRYVLNSVVLATVLFFAGIAQQFQVLNVQLALLGVATLFLIVGLVDLCILPRP